MSFDKTTFEVRAVKLGEITKHPNADSLSITEAFGNPVIMKTGSFKSGDWAVYVPVDSLVPVNRPEFNFLECGRDKERIKAKKLRGIFSMGLLVPIPPGVNFDQNTDFAPILGVEKWVSPTELDELKEESQKVANKKKAKVKAPNLPVYGLESFRKYKDVFLEGEEVVITEKLHGMNAKFLHDGKRLFIGSHKVMRGATRHYIWDLIEQAKFKLMDLFKIKRPEYVPVGDIWWKVAESFNLKKKLRKAPGLIFFGEVYGEKVQNLTYDSPKGQTLRLFDIFDTKKKQFLGTKDFFSICHMLDLPTVPILYIGPWSKEVEARWKNYADTASTVLYLPGTKPHMAEGIVIKPQKERTDVRVGRVAMKYVGQQYLLAKET